MELLILAFLQAPELKFIHPIYYIHLAQGEISKGIQWIITDTYSWSLSWGVSVGLVLLAISPFYRYI